MIDPDRRVGETFVQTAMNQTARRRNDEIDERLGTSTPALAQLTDALFEDYSADDWGLRRFASVADEETRAVASDLVMSAVEGVQVNVRELALCAIDIQELVGPNGRLMPGPTTTVDELLDGKRLHRAVTDLVRALGSTIDCLAAATVGLVGLPTSLHAAAGSLLLSVPEITKRAPATQRDARERVQRAFDTVAGEPDGWLAWGLELRDAVVHRGHLTQTFLPCPTGGGTRIELVSTTPARYLRRIEPHLRAQPWLPDMLSLTAPGAGPEALWLSEPTLQTAVELRVRTVALVEALAAVLVDVASTTYPDWILPSEKWALSRDPTRPRTKAASRFKGFDVSYPTPHVTGIAVHPHSAARLQLAERLRVRLAANSPCRRETLS